MDNVEFLIWDNLGKHIKFFKRNMGTTEKAHFINGFSYLLF